jgi:predicted nucleotide-binding protein
MSSLKTALLALAEALDQFRAAHSDEASTQQLARLREAAASAGEAASGSWWGYHSRVYYEGLEPVPPGARFSVEWGLMPTAFVRETKGAWVEYAFRDVMDEIYRRADNPELNSARQHADALSQNFESAKQHTLSMLSLALAERPDDYMQGIMTEATNLEPVTEKAIVEAMMPKNSVMSRDMTALQQGLQSPPHINVIACTIALEWPYKVNERLVELCRRAASHIARQEQVMRTRHEVGKKIFIGHGHSLVWRELKDFLQDRLNLAWDEFNRVPVAGVTNVARLSEMLDNAAIALLIMTAEDEQRDGSMRARLNVVHEAGLFQGRLGFTRALILLEEGCESFSNIDGVGQFRFPRGRISAVYEDGRLVLEREGLLAP